MIKVEESACCRVDLAGGTADLWPLYLYLGGLELVNMAINVRAKVQIEYEPSDKEEFRFSFESKDYGTRLKLKSLKELEASLKLSPKANPLRWVARVVHHYVKNSKKFGHWRIYTQSDAPPGSGLGGSSVLGIALSKAMEKALGSKLWEGPWDLQRTTRDLECLEIEFPAGDQDYVPAIFGGLLIFSLSENKRDVQKLPDSLGRQISERTALLYTGKPHHSGLNNWQVFTEMHKAKSKCRKHLQEIVQISKQMAEELRAGSLKNLAALVNKEWECRKKLSPAVNAKVLDKAWKFGKSKGAIARKACGAGGGGCLLLVFKSPEDKDRALSSVLPSSSWRWLSTEIGT